MSNLSHAGRRMILPLPLERNVWICRDWAPEIISCSFLKYCDCVKWWWGVRWGSGRRQQSLSDMTAFYCFSEAKTHLHILWNTVRLAHGSKGKRVLFRLILLYFNKKTKKTEHCEGLKPQVRRQNRLVKLRKYSNWSGQTVTFCFFLQTTRVEERRWTAEGVKYCFWDFFSCHKYWTVNISVHRYSVDFLCLTLYLAVSLRRALRKKKDKHDKNKQNFQSIARKVCSHEPDLQHGSTQRESCKGIWRIEQWHKNKDV